MKNSFLIFAALLPLLSFGDFKVRIKYFSDVGSTNTIYHSFSNVPDESSLYYLYFNNRFGFLKISSGVSSPGLSTSTAWYHSLFDGQISTNANHYVISPAVYPRVYDLYLIASSLVDNGYTGSGIEHIVTVGSRSGYNVFFPAIVSDVFSSTNSVFRQILLSQLSNVNGSLQSLALSLSSISSDYKAVNNLYLDPTKDTLFNSAANSVTLNGDSGGSQNLTRLYSDSYAGRESEITKALSDLARSQLQSVWLSTLDPESPFFGDNINDILNDPSKFQQAASHGGGGSSLAKIMRDVKRLSTNDWASGVTNQLANNTASITNQLAHMFDDDTSAGSRLGNIESSVYQSASAAGSIDDRLARGITVAVVNQGNTSVGVHLDGPVNIDLPQFNSLSVPLSSLQNTISDWYSDWYSFFSVSSPVYKWENFYNMVSSFKDQNHIDLAAVTNSLSSISSLSNFLAQIDEHLTNSLPNLTNFAIVSSSFSALLLDHYEDYISNSVYASSISKLESDYPSVYSNLVDFGLSPSGDGDFWTLFGSSLIQLDILADNFISDMALVRKFADDHIEGGFFAGINSIVEMFPSSSQLGDDLNNATNRLYEISLASTNLVLNFESVTNIAPSVFKPFADSFDSPPSGDIVFFKTANNQYVSIPVHDQASVWSLLRLGIAFALIAVQFILFPKFVLMIVVLFDRLSSRFIKFVPTVR